MGEVDHSAGLEHDDEAEREQRVHRAEREPTHEQLEKQCHCLVCSSLGAQVGAAAPRGRAGPAAGVPSAMRRPKSSTVTRSAMPMTSPMSCSTSRTGICRSSRMSRMRCGHDGGLVRVHAGRRLVEQQQVRLDAQGPGDLHPLLVAVRQAAGGDGRSLSPRPTKAAISLARARCRRSSRRAGGSRSAAARNPARVRWCRPSMRFSSTVSCRQQRDVLEGPGHAEPGDLVRPQPGQVGAVGSGRSRRPAGRRRTPR